MIRAMVWLTVGLEAILVARTLLLTALLPPLARALTRCASGPTCTDGAQEGPSRRPSGHDIALSLGSSWVFAAGGAVVIQADALGYTRLIHGAAPWWMAPLGFGAVLLLQDGVFYGVHRLLHHRHLYRWLHRGHHHSRHPTSWTTFAFDPGEAVLQSGFLVGVVFLIPLQPATLLALLLTMSAWAVLNHLDALAPQGQSPLRWLGRGLIGPAHHGLHHRRPGHNFGLYFTVWDKLCGTEAPPG